MVILLMICHQGFIGMMLAPFRVCYILPVNGGSIDWALVIHVFKYQGNFLLCFVGNIINRVAKQLVVGTL